MERLCVYPADVVVITGKSLRQAQRLIKDLRIILNKSEHQCITPRELAEYLDLDESKIKLK